jgi:predicted nucleic acid-binding protein
MIFVDSNILIDVLGEKQAWRNWSIDQLSELGSVNRLVVNQIGFAEVGPSLASIEHFRSWLTSFEIDYEPLDETASFAAGSAFIAYRNQRQVRDVSVLPDFLIGGHAKVLGATILTRDPRFYRSYFPEVPLITPSKDQK